jgi:hypothetical protein
VKRVAQMKISSMSIEKVTICVNEGPVRLNCGYCIGPVNNPVENDYLNDRLGAIFENPDVTLSEGDFLRLRNHDSNELTYYDKISRDDAALNFKHMDFLEEERIFIFSNLRSKVQKKIILRLGGRNARIKLWIDGLPVFNGKLLEIDSEFLLVEVDSGEHTMVIECGRVWTEMSTLMFSFRARDYEEDLLGDEGEITKSFIDRNLIGNIQLVREQVSSKNSWYELVLLPRDFVNLSKEEPLIVTVKDGTGRVYERIQTQMAKRIRIDLNADRERKGKECFLVLEVEYKSLSGIKRSITYAAVIGEFLKRAEELFCEYQALELRYPLSPIRKFMIDARMQNIRRIISKKHMMEENSECVLNAFKDDVDFICDMFACIEREVHEETSENICGIRHVYYVSKLDQCVERYCVSVPLGYSHERKYPLVIFIPTFRYEEEILKFHHGVEYGEVLLAEITCKGMTCGSYIGEASFMEGLERLKAFFSVDEDRIYLVGNCVGGYAAWALAQAYPYLFAGMVVLSGSQYEKNIQNLNHLNILNVCGDRDKYLEQVYSFPTNTLAKTSDRYKAVLIKDASRDGLSHVHKSSYIVKWLLEHRRERYPRKISFRTERMRHNKTNWIEIICLQEGKKYGKIEAEIENEGTIRLKSTHVRQFLLTLPEGINKDEIFIQVNEEEAFALHAAGRKTIAFEKNGEAYSVIAEESLCPVKDSSLGMGILDIYMDTVKIVVPSKYYTSEDERTLINNIAKAYSKPGTSASRPEIHIHYPVVESGQINAQDLYSCNLILIGSVYDNLLSSMKEGMPIQFDENGYSYQGVYAQGDYCIIMICANPFHPGKKVLCIYANHSRLLRNINTRKVILPTYYNGLHRVLNSEAILFDGKLYYVVPVMGDAMERV